jgi:hypothetical protein
MLRHVPIDPSESHLGVQSGTETILLRQQIRLEDGANDQHHRHLDHAVADARDAERPLASIALWYPYPQEGLWDVAPRNQLLPQRFQPSLLSLSVDLLERLPVDPRCSGVRTAASVGFLKNVLPANLVPKSIEAKGWFSLSFHL